MKILSSAWFIAVEDTKHSLRQRETLVWTFIMPIIFFYFIGTVTGGLAGGSSGQVEKIALEVPGEGGFLVDEIQRRLEAEGYAVQRNPENAPNYRRRLQIPETSSEHKRVIEIVVAESAGRVPVIAGAGSNNPVESIEYSLHAQEVGADGLLHVAGYYNRPKQPGLYAHFKMVHDACELPIDFGERGRLAPLAALEHNLGNPVLGYLGHDRSGQ